MVKCSRISILSSKTAGSTIVCIQYRISHWHLDIRAPATWHQDHWAMKKQLHGHDIELAMRENHAQGYVFWRRGNGNRVQLSG